MTSSRLKAPVRNVRLLGVGMRDTALSFLDNHSMPSGGDWGLGRIAAIFIKGAVDTTLDSIHMEKLDGNAITINGYARGTVIQNSLFHEIGDNIIAQLGETTGAGPIAAGMGPDGTDGNQPWGTIIKSNFAYRCGKCLEMCLEVCLDPPPSFRKISENLHLPRICFGEMEVVKGGWWG